MNSIKTILWPTDASESSLLALRAAILLGRKFEAKIHALQAIEPVPRLAESGFANEPLHTFDFPYYEQQLIEAARENLVKTVEDRIPAELRGEVRVELGSPKETIVQFVRDRQVDLVVMATHGRTGLSHLVLGSVAEATLRQSPVPVLVVPVGTVSDER